MASGIKSHKQPEDEGTLDRQEMKEVMREVVKEWLDDQFAHFGKWTARSIGAALFSVVLIYAINHGGFK